MYITFASAMRIRQNPLWLETQRRRHQKSPLLLGREGGLGVCVLDSSLLRSGQDVVVVVVVALGLLARALAGAARGQPAVVGVLEASAAGAGPRLGAGRRRPRAGGAGEGPPQRGTTRAVVRRELRLPPRARPRMEPAQPRT